MTPHEQPRARGGYTLAEMLIVVTIMIMLMAVTLPVAKKVMDGNQTREASRQLSAFFTMARARALQTGRPCGVYLSFANAPVGVVDPTSVTWTNYWPVRQVTDIHMAERPAPYSGSTTGAMGKMTVSGGNNVFICCWSDGSPNPSETTYLASLLASGEEFLVRFNYKGDWYVCKNNNGTFAYLQPYTAKTAVDYNRIPQPYGLTNTNAMGVPFQILRSPRPVGNPQTLPRGTCIDLTYSGIGTSGRGFPVPINSMPTGLTIMLEPDGGIDSLYLDTASSKLIPLADPASALYLLIGRPEKAPTDTSLTGITGAATLQNRDICNLADPTNIWVAINRLSGQVTTAENMPNPASAGTFAIFLRDARQAAINAEQMQGR